MKKQIMDIVDVANDINDSELGELTGKIESVLRSNDVEAARILLDDVSIRIDTASWDKSDKEKVDEITNLLAKIEDTSEGATDKQYKNAEKFWDKSDEDIKRAILKKAIPTMGDKYAMLDWSDLTDYIQDELASSYESLGENFINEARNIDSDVEGGISYIIQNEKDADDAADKIVKYLKDNGVKTKDIKGGIAYVIDDESNTDQAISAVIDHINNNLK